MFVYLNEIYKCFYGEAEERERWANAFSSGLEKDRFSKYASLAVITGDMTNFRIAFPASGAIFPCGIGFIEPGLTFGSFLLLLTVSLDS